MDNNMPMPEINKNTSDVSANMSSSLSEGVVSNDATPDESGLGTPTHAEKPIIENHQERLHNDMEVPLIPKEGIKVVATEKGFFGQHRKSVGDKFTVSSFKQLGEWMKCEDSNLEKKKVNFYKNKKAKK